MVILLARETWGGPYGWLWAPTFWHADRLIHIYGIYTSIYWNINY